MNRPWMPLYVPDYLGDTGHLSTLEHGAYMLLIMHYWMNDGLPAQDAQLARVARLPLKQWLTIRDTIQALFGDGWKHKRVEAEIQEARERYERRAKAGREGGKAKAENHPKPSNAVAMPQQEDGNAVATRGTRQPQPHFSDEKISSPPADEPPDDLEAEVRLIVGQEPVLLDPDFTPIAKLLDEVQPADILSGIRDALAKRHKRVRCWAEFDGWIRRAAKDRLAAAPRRNGAHMHRPREGPTRTTPDQIVDPLIRAGAKYFTADP